MRKPVASDLNAQLLKKLLEAEADADVARAKADAARAKADLVRAKIEASGKIIAWDYDKSPSEKSVQDHPGLQGP